MDHGRCVPQRGWDNNSAMEGYGPVNESNFRFGGSYNGKRFQNEGFSRDSSGRNAFHQDTQGRDAYSRPPGAPDFWPQQRQKFEGGYSLDQESKRHDTFHDVDYHSPEKFQEFDAHRGASRFHDRYQNMDNYYEGGSYHDNHRYERRDIFDRDRGSDYESRPHNSRRSRERSDDRGFDYDRYSYDSDYDRDRRDTWRRHESRDREHDRRGLSHESEGSPYKHRDRSRSRGRDDGSRSRSPCGRSRGRSHRDDMYDDARYERADRRREHNWDERRHADAPAVPSPTVVVKGLSQRTTEEDLYQILGEWGPLRNIRIIKERNSGMSRGFAFIDFHTVEAAQKMMDGIGENGLEIDGRNLFFEYSSKPTGGAGAPSLGQESFGRPSYGNRAFSAPCDWICIICGCINFARRTSCFQCNEARSEDAPPADGVASIPSFAGRRGSELGPSHVLVVRGLDENADEEMLRYEFAKYAPLKDIRLVRDKFTHVSRGFAFVHFHSVEDASKALEATNGTTFEKNGQVLRVAYAKSTHGPPLGAPQSSRLAAAAIEAATFAQQYDAVGWAPKEYNPDEKRMQNNNMDSLNAGSAVQSGFVWDEKSGYYFDAASGFYYDGNTGLYYDGNAGIWYSYDENTQKYVPCNDQSNQTSGVSATESSKTNVGNGSSKAVISAPAATVKQDEKASLADAVHAAATAALAAEKREKGKIKEIKLNSKSSLSANKKKINNVLALWKQRNQEGHAARVVLDDKDPPGATNDKNNSSIMTSGGMPSNSKSGSVTAKDVNMSGSHTSLANHGTMTISGEHDSEIKPRPVSNSLGGTVMGVIRGSGMGVVKSGPTFPSSASLGSADMSSSALHLSSKPDSTTIAPYRIDASSLGPNVPPGNSGTGKRRFSEAPAQSVLKDHPSQSVYRDRAAERRMLYGSSSSNDPPDVEHHDLTPGYTSRKASSEVGSMPFPPGVGMRTVGDNGMAESYEVITTDRSIDESNVGNRILRSMGWQEGLGLGKDGSGIKEPVQAKAVGDRAGLGSQQRASDPVLEAQAGDSYRTIMQKKAILRFREMS